MPALVTTKWRADRSFYAREYIPRGPRDVLLLQPMLSTLLTRPPLVMISDPVPRAAQIDSKMCEQFVLLKKTICAPKKTIRAPKKQFVLLFVQLQILLIRTEAVRADYFLIPRPD